MRKHNQDDMKVPVRRIEKGFKPLFDFSKGVRLSEVSKQLRDVEENPEDYEWVTLGEIREGLEEEGETPPETHEKRSRRKSP